MLIIRLVEDGRRNLLRTLLFADIVVLISDSRKEVKQELGQNVGLQIESQQGDSE